MYRLTQVQTDLRNKLAIETKDELVHGIHDKKFQEEKKEEKKQENINKKKLVKEKKYYTIECHNYNKDSINIDAVIDKEDNNSTGIFIDKRE